MNIDKNKFFQRQTLIPEIGGLGQKKWEDASVLIIGLGGLGCPSALQLALAGIGKIGLVDFDIVEVSNLHRQTLFTWNHIGRKKIEVVSEVLKEHAPCIKIETYSEFINSYTNSSMFQAWDIVLDCTDTISSKYAINDFCLEKRIPLVTASVYRTSAQFAIFSGKGKPCYRCLFPNLNQGDTLSCNEGGVLGVQTSLAGNYQASLVLQYLLNPNQIEFDTVYFMEWNPISLYKSKLQEDPDCICQKTPNQVQDAKEKKYEIDYEEWIKLKNEGSAFLLDVREMEEVLENPIANVIHFPLSELRNGKKPNLKVDQTIVCICESGVRSLEALTFLNHFPKRYSMLGGRKLFVHRLTEE